MADEYFSPPTNDPLAAQVWELSGWWRRVGALVIDSLIIASPVFVAGVIAVFTVGSGADGGSTQRDLGLSDWVVFIGILMALIVIPTIYYCWTMSAWNGQTVGKRTLDIRVVRESGEAVTAWFAFVRQIVVIAFLFGFLGGILYGLPQLIDYLWPLWDAKHQALHDKMVKSRVVRAAPRQDVPPPDGQAAPESRPVPQVPPDPFAPPQVPQQPQAPFPQAPPPAQMPPAPPSPGGTPQPYVPPPGYENPVPEDER